MTKKQWESYSNLKEQCINKLSGLAYDLKVRDKELESLRSWITESWIRDDLDDLRVKILESLRDVFDVIALTQEIRKIIEQLYTDSDGKYDPDKSDQISFM